MPADVSAVMSGFWTLVFLATAVSKSFIRKRQRNAAADCGAGMKSACAAGVPMKRRKGSGDPTRSALTSPWTA